ncbi:haloalkane dehalogenase [Deinococcus deserti]|uniref:Haloalkane dehalogenase n=1 Tax=Deinococcus deserti (strain DSM 17065 / CIP 109153 / LMG 22923 / VCD115) TaxID=546414 RepID=C1CWE6_DEIDV|nr:haloalkane dehalogenase [Deinococcus deserti]ACO46513.1 putative Haloalkane dehalogenase [Deinococcus deserti VCD115]
MTKASGPSATDPYARTRVQVLDSELAFVDTGGGGRPIVFLHGNPTSSYLWRNVIPEVEGLGRCLAPDLVGMGESGKAPAGNYSIAEHARYLDAWFDTLGLRDVILVLHDWGGPLGFHWAARHPERVAGIVYMETIVQPVTWDDWDPGGVRIFQALRSRAGEELILQKNVFIERILPSSVIRPLGEQEMEAYRRPFLSAGEERRPMLTFPRQLPIDGEPPEVIDLVERYGQFLKTTPIPKLFINAEPGSILTGRQREFCRSWPNQQEVTVAGRHFIQEDSPREIGQAVANFVRELVVHS